MRKALATLAAALATATALAAPAAASATAGFAPTHGAYRSVVCEQVADGCTQVAETEVKPEPVAA